MECVGSGKCFLGHGSEFPNPLRYLQRLGQAGYTASVTFTATTELQNAMSSPLNNNIKELAQK